MGEVTGRIVDQIIENRGRFERFCLSLSAEELDRPVPESTWSVRDFASHLATLDPALLRLFEATAAGERIYAPDGGAFDVDAHNEELVSVRRDWPIARILEEGRGHRAALIDTLRRITDEQTAQQKLHFGGDAKRGAGDVPFGLFLAGWAMHDPIHVADMVRALPERSGEAELASWLDNPFVRGYQAAMNG